MTTHALSHLKYIGKYERTDGLGEVISTAPEIDSEYFEHTAVSGREGQGHRLC